eukprot:scaffold7168_cov182-Amphora_coffeaeformis.AAC.2
MMFVALICYMWLPLIFGFAVPRLSVIRAITTTHRAAAVKENEEPLSVMFQRAVVCQRAGNYEEALKEYKLILQAAQQCDVAPDKYAEVHGNLGALYLRNKDVARAKFHFQTALEHRPMGTVHVNLAVLLLQELSTVQDKTLGLEILAKAQRHCQDALALPEDGREHTVATRLLQDMDKMMSQLI